MVSCKYRLRRRFHRDGRIGGGAILKGWANVDGERLEDWSKVGQGGFE